MSAPIAPHHIALILPELEAGGAQRIMLLLAREFTARGHKVDLVVMNAKGPLLSEIPDSLRLIDLGAITGRGQATFALSSIRHLVTWLRSERPEALLSTITGANLVSVVAKVISGVPATLTLRQAVTLENVSNPIHRIAMKLLYSRADAIVALSTAMAEQLVRRLRIPAKKIHCIPNPVDTLQVMAQGKAPLSHPWLEDPSLKVIISVGRLIVQKDHSTLLHAFARATRDHATRLIIVGEGPERKNLEDLAQQLGIADRFELPGFDPNPWRWMARADLFVLSSRWEGHPNALLEALALNLPTVVSEYDISVCALRHNFKLQTFKTGDHISLGHLIGELSRNPIPRPSVQLDTVSHATDQYLETMLSRDQT